MSEEGPLEPVAPESEPPTQPQAAADPTQPVPTASDPAPAPAWPTPPAAAVPGRSSTVAVPKWLILVLGGLAVGLLGFAIGWIAAPGGDSSTVVVRPGGGFAPGDGNGFFPNPGNGGNGNGSGGNSPTVPSVPRIPRRQGGAFLGVASSTATDPAGARVVTVVPASPAANGGLKVDDVITKIGGETVKTPRQLANRIGAHRPGDEVTLTYQREGKSDTATVRLVARASVQIPTPSTTSPGL
ncbi:MAG TPA: PDZ domain-containing protein [Acidimicrobiia bacterium]